MSDRNQRRTRNTILVAGIAAAGLLAAVFATSQIMSPATATAQMGIDDGQTDTTLYSQPESALMTSTSSSQASPYHDDNGYNRSTLSTFGRAVTMTQPDRISISVAVETTRDTAQQAASDNADQVSQVIEALRELGIEDERMSTGQFNLQPVYGEPVQSPQEDEEADTETEVIPVPPEREPRMEIVGYRAFNSIMVNLDTDGEIDAGRVIDAAVGAGATNVSDLFLYISQERQQEIRNALIADSIADARQRADMAAGAVGMQITGIKSISLEEVFFPFAGRGLEAMPAADFATTILPGEQEVTSTVQITYYISSNGNGDDNGSDNENGESGTEEQ